MEIRQKEYTKKELLLMKRKLIELETMENKYNRFISFLTFASIATGSGAAISLSKYLEETMELKKAGICGISCLTVATVLGIGNLYVTKERNSVSDEYIEIMCEAPDEVLAAVDKHFGR